MNRSAVIFDLDGTLTRPYLDFDAIRAEIGIADGPILEAIQTMTEPDRARATDILDRHERDAAEHATLFDGTIEALSELRDMGMPIAIVTRNARRWVTVVLDRFGIVVDAIRTREDGAIKPSGAPILSICKELSRDPAASWMIGDFLFDILSGQEAGSRTVLMIGDGPRPEFANRADFVIRRLTELAGIIRTSRANNVGD